MEPEDCLRSLAAEALRWAHPHRPLFPVSLGLMAVANAFVMLGLLPEPRAEAVLADHKSALERMGLGNTWGVTKGELTVRPGAHEYWQSRMAGPGGLREVPLLVAAAGVCCPTSVAEVCFEWVKLTSTGWRLTFRATAPDPGGNPPAAHVVMGQAMSEISLIDDAGQSHDLHAEGVGWSRLEERGEQEWHGPMITPCFQVRAVDDAGNEHEGMPGDWQGFPGHEGSSNFWFWPPVPQDRKSIRVTVNTLWEAAWADIELPR